MAFRDYFGGITSLGGSIINGIFQGISNRAQAKENEKNRQFAIDMFNRENEFNLPINQIARFQQAGLNSALVYGQGAQTLSAHASSPSTNNQYNAPQLDVNSALGAYFQSKQLKNETKVAESIEYKNNTDAAKNISDSNLADMQRIKLSNENQFFMDNYQAQLETNLQNLELLKKEGLIKDEEYNVQKQKALEAIENVRRAKAEANTAEEQTRTQEATTANVRQSTITLGAQEEAFRASAKLSSAEAVKALEEARTQSVMRAKLSTDSLLNQANITYLRKMGAKTDAEAEKIIIDAYNAVKNGDVERFIKTGPQRFGTSTLGAAVGILLDEFGINPRTQTIGGYVTDKLKPVFKPAMYNINKAVKKHNKRGHVGRR